MLLLEEIKTNIGGCFLLQEIKANIGGCFLFEEMKTNIGGCFLLGEIKTISLPRPILVSVLSEEIETKEDQVQYWWVFFVA